MPAPSLPSRLPGLNLPRCSLCPRGRDTCHHRAFWGGDTPPSPAAGGAAPAPGLRGQPVWWGKERTAPPGSGQPVRRERRLHRKELRQGCRGLQAGVLCAPLRCTSQSWRQQRELDVACCKEGGEENRL